MSDTVDPIPQPAKTAPAKRKRRKPAAILPYSMPNGEPVPTHVIGDNGKLRPIKPQERIFAMAWGCPDSPTFGNGLQSMRVANPSLSPPVANAMASEYLTRPSVTGTIAQILNQAGLGVEVRADTIRRIISHSDIGRAISKTTRTDAGDAITETTHGPGYRDILRAIEVVNKMDGLYAKQQAAVNVAEDEYRQLVKRFFGGTKGTNTVSRSTAIRHTPIDSNERADTDTADHVENSPVTSVEAPGTGAEAGVGVLTAPQVDCVSPSPTADKNSGKGGM